MQLKNTPFKDIPKYCISLERCQDRRELVAEEFKKVGLHDVKFFNGIDGHKIKLPELSSKLKGMHAEGILGCMFSHLALLKEVRSRGEEVICVFEDDIIVFDDFQERIKYIEDSGAEFDYLALGGHFTSQKIGTLVGVGEDTEHPYIFKVREKGGTYGYIITAPVMDFIIRNITYHFGMDHFMGEVVYGTFMCLAFIPFLVGCRPCVSQISNTFWKYDAIDYYYQQSAIDFKAEYKHITEIIITEEENRKRIGDAARAALLAQERN